MFTCRTPAKKGDQGPEPRSTPEKPPTPTLNVRKSIGEWESAKPDASDRLQTNTPNALAGTSKPKRALALSQETRGSPRTTPVEIISPIALRGYANKTSEARAYLNKAKQHLNSARNLKTEIKTAVVQAIDRLYHLVKEAEGAQEAKSEPHGGNQEKEIPQTPDKQNQLLSRIEEHSKLLLESNLKMEELKVAMERNSEARVTYSSVTAGKPATVHSERVALHSIVVTSEDVTESGEQVLDKVREAVDAKEGWVRVERVRKAKDRKIIMSCRTEDERNKIKDRIEKAGKRLVCEEVNNKDPLLILKDVLLKNSDEDVIKALTNQNRNIFSNLESKDDRISIKYRRRARNPLTGHIVVSTSPTIWRRAMDAGALHIDLQRIKVEDQSPLVQCTRCLGYGHGKRFCRETVDLCSHCGGPHLRADCELRTIPPTCKNCTLAKYDQTEHNAFSQTCPVRKRWDMLARTSVAYC